MELNYKFKGCYFYVLHLFEDFKWYFHTFWDLKGATVMLYIDLRLLKTCFHFYLVNLNFENHIMLMGSLSLLFRYLDILSSPNNCWVWNCSQTDWLMDGQTFVDIELSQTTYWTAFQTLTKFCDRAAVGVLKF